MLIGFTIMQTAFSGGGALRALGDDAERRALAMTGSGDAIFDWDVTADQHLRQRRRRERARACKRGALEGPAAGWLDMLHPLDRDRYSAALDGMLLQRSGRIRHDLRLRGADGHYTWFLLKARPVLDASGDVVRVIGTFEDVTESRAAAERILHDAIHDHLTGLPNRELFFDRLESAIAVGAPARRPRPRRGAVRHRPAGGDQRHARHVVRRFRAADHRAPRRARSQARRHAGAARRRPVRRHPAARARLRRRRLRRRAAQAARQPHQLRRPRSLGDRQRRPRRVRRRRRTPRRRICSARRRSRWPTPRRAAATARRCSSASCATAANRAHSLGAELRHALSRNEIFVLFQPIVRLEDRTVAGFEATPRWRHPRLGVLSPAEFLRDSEGALAMAEIGAFALDYAARELAAWQTSARRQSADLRAARPVLAPDARPRSAGRPARPRSAAIPSRAAR